MTTQQKIETYWRLWHEAIKAQDIAKAVRCKRAIDVLTLAQGAVAARAARRALSNVLPCLAGAR